MDKDLREEIEKWPLIYQRVYIKEDTTLVREVYVRRVEGFPLSGEAAVNDRRYGWWDPKTKEWYLFLNFTTESRDNYALGFEKIELPGHFRGGNFLTNYDYYIHTKTDRTIFKEEEGIVYGSCLNRVADLEILKGFPRITYPIAPRKRNMDLNLLGAIYLGSKIYALWGQDGIPVTLSHLNGMEELNGITTVSRKLLKLCKVSEGKLKKYSMAFTTAMGKSRILEAEGEIKKNLTIDKSIGDKSRLGSITNPKRLNRLGSFWTPEDGWYFYKLPERFTEFKKSGFLRPSDSLKERLHTMERQGSVDEQNQLCFYSRNDQDYYAGSYYALGKLEKGGNPRMIPDLKEYVPTEIDDFITRPDDKVLCILSGFFDDRYALMARKDGRVLGWEYLVSEKDVLEGGFLRVPHLRYFVHSEDLKAGIEAMRAQLVNEIAL